MITKIQRVQTRVQQKYKEIWFTCQLPISNANGCHNDKLWVKIINICSTAGCSMRNLASFVDRNYSRIV